MTSPSIPTATESELGPKPERTARDAGPFPYVGSESERTLETAIPTQFDTRSTRVLYSSGGSAGPKGSTDCPDCGTETINGAGLFACSRCDWSGTLR